MFDRRMVWVGLLGVSVGACGGESFDAAPAAPVALAELPAKYAAATCAALEGCLGADLVKLFLGGASCTDRFLPVVANSTYSMYAGRIAAGTMRYDAAKMQACLNVIAARSCAQMDDRDPPECLAAIDGTVDLGGDCTLNEECKGSAMCQSANATCPGKCVTLLAAGQACVKDEECQSGLVCSKETALCVHPVGEGQKCEYGQPPCVSGLLCLGKDDKAKTSGTCLSSAHALAADKGAPCDPAKGQLCKSGLSCAVQTVTLAPLAVTFQCVETGSYAAGVACKMAFPEACASGTYCKTTVLQPFDGACTAMPAAGETCGGVGCPTNPAECVCQPSAVCIANTCQNLANNGMTCTGDAMCYSESCVAGGCAVKVPCK